MIRAAIRGSSIFERHSLWRFAAHAYRSHRRNRTARLTHIRDRSDRRRVDDRSGGRNVDDGTHDHHVNGFDGRYDVHDMSAFDGHRTSVLHLKRNAADDERDALMMLLDFLLGSSIDDIAAARPTRSRADVEEALRTVLLEYGFTASRERRA